ncbi:protein MpATXR8 [Marchantia polymorpha subsp. ruderalis]|uniref:SET domain-containing protein n=2 Tax=Marchantia polymorpha TaxID=3197 RepID=A0AAF6BTR1_MARPO|nr:hypothetical protein MARPO_0045s0136 [Marchantia polymorpha]PTQ39493.1 hypothetical protein MARPO_0045s0136 [Marchantia polymorpha]BBN15395.1 hypothetical protein Mp_6g19270 [Marchantia polymorpha subsp. ruderalis]BBN15396.1 hypothetical protein Mp_6g19270 [Marchantia polymorpha subsp. ruderalis]|eukprot:PTQ39492.1 hypothetical protein MARPO_0045s0136 [Marchantia polymorpha]
MAAEAIRAEGNDLYARGRYTQAINKYELYIELVTKEKGGLDRIVCGHSNRAQAYLQLRKYTKALEDVRKALELDPTHLKSLVRKAKALEGLKIYQDVVTIYKSLLQNFKDQLHDVHVKDFLRSLQDAERKDKMTRLGQYEELVDSYWDQPCPNGAPMMEEYVGPVELRRVERMDRGLFATKDLEPGDLLFVSNSIVTVRVPIAKGDIQISVESKSEAMHLVLDSLKRFVNHAFDNLQDFSQFQLLVQVDTLAGPYPTAPLSRDCPSMRYFTPVNALPPGLRNLMRPDLDHPTIRADFSHSTLMKVVERRQFTHWGNDHDELTGIYALPSLMNHSCTPNVTVTTMQNESVTKIFRACKSVKKGEELFYAYHNIFCPLEDRRAFYPTLCCTCARCKLEERLVAEVPALKSLEAQCSKFWEQKSSFSQLSPEERAKRRNQCIICIRLVEELLQKNSKLQILRTHEKDWIRATLIRFHRLLLDPALSLKDDALKEDQLSEMRLIFEAVRAMRTVNPGSDIALAMISEEYSRVVNQNSRKELEPHGLSDLFLTGLEITRLMNGPKLKYRTILKLFNYTSILLCGHQ